ncbi:carbamoyl-phosphate synthase [Bacillus cereus]|uniref:phage tail protein n=1 Tax=Bacillus cereus TaxID=1396 RepID=UPI00103DEB3C|nr:carbamoyl-phosphate synthase [Bacillus cereus]TBX83970.1 carbamoyl-phosphate synthase [Bacillus cereus]
MADGRVEIDARINNNNVRRDVQNINRELNRIGEGMPNIARDIADETTARFDSMGRRIRYAYRGTSEEARRMYSEMRSAHYQQAIAMRGLKDQMIGVEYRYFQLARASQNYTGTTAQFMDQVRSLGAEQKRVADAMINANRLQMISMLQTAGAMANMTTQAQRISQNYQRMANPLYNVNRAGLAVAGTLNRIANNGNAASLALRLLGPTASMKELLDMQRMINQGFMRFQMVALGAAITSYLFYGALHKANMEMNPKYAEAYNNMIEKLTKALQPMRDAFAAVMIPIYNFISAIADLIIKFNEAHPVLARFIQGMIMLVPLLTLLLSPLAIGIGLWAGMQAALASLWPIIGPVVTGLMAMSGTVWLVAAALAGIAVGFSYAYKHVEPFRNAVNNSISTVKAFGKAVAAMGKYLFFAAVDGDYLNDWITHLPEGFQNAAQVIGMAVAKIRDGILQLINAVKSAFQGNFDPLIQIFVNLIPTIIGIIVGGIPGLVIAVSRWFIAMSDGLAGGSAGFISKFQTILQTAVTQIVSFLTTQLPQFVQKGVEILTSIINGIVQSLPQLVTTITTIIQTLVNGFAVLLPTILQIGIQIIQSLITGIVQILPALVTSAAQIITTLINGIIVVLPTLIQVGIQIMQTLIQSIITLLPTLIELGMNLLMTLVNAIIQNLPMIINAGMQIITTLITAIVTLLPQIIEAGMQLLMSLINGILQVLPQLIDAVLQIVTKFLEVLTQNLPQIIAMGMDMLVKLVEGIIQMLPQIVDACIQIITKFTEIIIQNLPQIIDAGVKILTALINGIIQVLPQLVEAGIRLMVELLKAIIDHLPQLLEAGVELIGALIDGILSLLGEVFSSGVEIGSQLLDSLGDVDLFDIGVNIVQGLISGIGSMVGSAVSAAKELGSSIAGAVKGILDIHSPSRVMKDLGIYTGQGLVKGIQAMGNPVYNAAGKMANTVKSAFDSLSDGINLGNVATGSTSGVSNNSLLGQIDNLASLIMPNIQSNAYASPSNGTVSNTKNVTNNNTPVSVVLNYNGSASETDMLRMVDFIEQELGRRLGNQMFISGVRMG